MRNKEEVRREDMKKRKKAAGKIASSVLCSVLAVSMAATPVLPAAAAGTQSTETSDSVSERFLLNYQTVDINLADSFDLPLYLTTGYYTEPSGTGKITWTRTVRSCIGLNPA